MSTHQLLTSGYGRQVRLLVQVLPVIFEESCVGMHPGPDLLAWWIWAGPIGFPPTLGAWESTC